MDGGLVTGLVTLRPAAGSSAAASLGVIFWPCSDKGTLQSAFPLGRHLEGISLLFCLGSRRGEGSSIAHWLWPVMVGVTPSLASVAPIGANLLLARQPLGNFVLIAWLQFSPVESPAGCWRSRPFGRTRSSRAEAVGIPGTPAGVLPGPWCAP
jgi:hypothetical protein